MKGGTIIRLYHLGYIIGRKFLVESKNHRSGRCRVDHLSFRRSWCPVTSQKSKLSFFLGTIGQGMSWQRFTGRHRCCNLTGDITFHDGINKAVRSWKADLLAQQANSLYQRLMAFMGQFDRSFLKCIWHYCAASTKHKVTIHRSQLTVHVGKYLRVFGLTPSPGFRLFHWLVEMKWISSWRGTSFLVASLISLLRTLNVAWDIMKLTYCSADSVMRWHFVSPWWCVTI